MCKMALNQTANIRLFAQIDKVFVSKIDIEAIKKTPMLTNNINNDSDDDDLVETKKLLVESYGDWELLACLLNSKDFNSREEFDDWTIEKHLRINEEEMVKEISLEDVLDRLDVEISPNMAYYLEHRDELEKDLNRRLNDLSELKDPRLEKELLYKQLCQIFGNDNSSDTDNEYMLKDFKLLENMGDSRTATAKKGKFEYYAS